MSSDVSIKSLLIQLIGDEPLPFDRWRHETVIECAYKPSFGGKPKIEDHLSMLACEFVGQSRLKLVHASLIVLIRRGLSSDIAYRHFCDLWTGHAQFLLEVLDSGWLVSACDTICDHSSDPLERQTTALAVLFVNTLKLAETERRMFEQCPPTLQKPGRLAIFDGMTAFVVGRGDMVENMLRRLEACLVDASFSGAIVKTLVNRALAADTVFGRLRRMQERARWKPYLLSRNRDTVLASPSVAVAKSKREVSSGYVLLNDTSRLASGFHLGPALVCEAIRANLAERGLQGIGTANDKAGLDRLLDTFPSPSLIVLNGEGTMHHDGRRAVELLSMCAQAKQRGSQIALINSVWEANSPATDELLSACDLIHVRDTASARQLPQGYSVQVTPDVSIPLFLKLFRTGTFDAPSSDIGVIDSVRKPVSMILGSFAEAANLPFFAMSGLSLFAIREEIARQRMELPCRILQFPDVKASKSWVTGRFHGLLAALCAGAPVCAVPSNTGKIEGLLHDAGLQDACLLDEAWLDAGHADKLAEIERRVLMQRSDAFRLKRDRFLTEADLRVSRMFDEVAKLALRS